MDVNASMTRRSALLAGAALAAAYALPAWAQAKPTLRFAAVFSDKDIRAGMIEMLMKDVEGDFKIEPFYNGSLFKQGTELVALQRNNSLAGTDCRSGFHEQSLVLPERYRLSTARAQPQHDASLVAR